MKHITKISLFIVLLSLAMAIGWWFSRPGPSRPSTKTVRMSPEGTAAKTGTDEQSQVRVSQPNARTPFLGQKDPRWTEYRRLRALNPGYEWETPIEFFGKVVDEKNQPVSDVQIDCSWSGTIERYGGDGVGHRSLKSGLDGLFSISGIEGKGMTIQLSKEGYYRRKSWNNNIFEYAGFWEPTFTEPDKNNPIVFHLVKRPVAELTYRVGERLFLQPPELETHIDLLSKTAQSLVPSDLYVRIHRPAGASYEKPFNWSIIIEGRNGVEIVETTEEFMLKAPVDGYKAQLSREYQNPTGNARQTVRFYVRSKTRGFYAAVDFEMAAYRRINGTQPASIIIDAVVNPNNSPNVEYDPAKNIREMAKGNNR